MATRTELYSRSQRERAEAALAIVDRWAEGQRNSDGLRFVSFPSGHAPKAGELPVVYHTRLDGLGCDCPAASKSRTGRCWHKLAVLLRADRDEAEYLRQVLADLRPQRCPEGPEDAAMIVPPLKSYRDIFPGCAAGCGQVTEGRDGFCDACASDRERQQRMTAKRENQAELKRLNALLFGSAED